MSIPDVPYQYEWVAVPAPFLQSGGELSTALFHDASSTLPVRLRVYCSTPAKYETLRSIIFTVYASRTLESQPIEIANLTKQHNLPLIQYGQTNNQEYKDYTIDLSGIARTMLSHDLPLILGWQGGQATFIQGGSQINGENYNYDIALIQPCTMNNVTLWVRADAIVQSPATGLTSIQNAVQGQGYVGFTVCNTVNDSVANGAVKTSAYRIGVDENMKFLNKMKSNSEASLKNPLLKKMVTQKAKDEASLYGFWSKKVTDYAQYGIAFYFKNKKNQNLENAQMWGDFGRLNSIQPPIDDFIYHAGTFFQIPVGLKTMMLRNPFVMAHGLNDNLLSYHCCALERATGNKISESRFFAVEYEKNPFDITFTPAPFSSATNLSFNDATEWTFVATAGTTKGFTISGGKLNGFSSSSDKQIVYNPSLLIASGRLHKLTIDCSVVPSDGAEMEIGVYSSGAFYPSESFIVQDQEKGASGVVFEQTIYFCLPFDANFAPLAFKKAPNKAVHSIDNISVGQSTKLQENPRAEAYPDLRVFYLNRLGAMDYFDFRAEYKEQIDIKRNIIHTEDEMKYDPDKIGRNSNRGGIHFLPDIDSVTPIGYENVEGNGTATNNPYGNAGYPDQDNIISNFKEPHKRNKAALSSQIKRKYKLSSGEITKWLARDLEDLLTSNAIYIQRWHDNIDDLSTYGQNYLEPVLMEDGAFTVVDEDRQSVRLDITLESAKSFKTQHGI